MNKSIKDNVKCSGCGVCKIVCPKNAIALSIDNKGFIRPFVNDNCIGCGLCVRHCHEHKNDSGNTVKRAYTAMSNNADVRAMSSSGGIFTEIAHKIIENGGFVCASGFDKNFNLSHSIVEKEEELSPLRQSKYLESDVSTVWSGLKRKISSGQNGLFVGTPCQCSALHSLLDKEKLSSLIVCDFICHGVASPLIFDKFKSYLKSHYGAPLNIEFRHKENGCGSYFYYKGSIGKYIIPNYARSYPFAYASGLIIADDCTDCKYCSINRYSDITLGDFVSGPTDFSKSTIFVNTNRGIEYLENVRVSHCNMKI